MHVQNEPQIVNYSSIRIIEFCIITINKLSTITGVFTKLNYP